MEEEDNSKLALEFQLQEVLFASFGDGADSFSNPTPPDHIVSESSLCNVLKEQAEIEMMKYEEEMLNEAEKERFRLDLRQQIHDRAFASQLAMVPEDEWCRTRDNFKRPRSPRCEGSSSSDGQVLRFRVYVKGLVDKSKMVGGIGVAICDQNDGLLFEISQGVSASEHEFDAELVEVKALIQGLHFAVMLGLQKIKIVSDNPLIYQYITGKKHSRKANAAALDEVNLLLGKFNHVRPSLVEQYKDVNFAIELARNAMALQASRSATIKNEKDTVETCEICFEDTHMDQMFQIRSCLHSYCFSCISKHVQFELRHRVLPKCPHEDCKSKLGLDDCRKFLNPELFEILSQRVKEASIPAEDKIYCPYPRCSALFSKTELQGCKGNSTGDIEKGARKCPKCDGTFCINCKVPWHANMTCFDHKIRNPNPSREEKKLHSLATKKRWRQCPKCSNMVSLSRGCNRIKCRCGQEFCYRCGAKWEERKICTCFAWNEHNIIYDERDGHHERRMS